MINAIGGQNDAYYHLLARLPLFSRNSKKIKTQKPVGFALSQGD
jgi:hypothetical protein